jgi:hypothetical protein
MPLNTNLVIKSLIIMRKPSSLTRSTPSTKWADAEKLEMLQLNDYKSFIDAGIHKHDPIPEGYKKI